MRSFLLPRVREIGERLRCLMIKTKTLLSCSSPLTKDETNLMEFTKDETNLMDLHSEILIEILKRVPAKSVCRIRCVNKTMLSIVDNTPSFVTLHTRSMIAADSPHHVQHSSCTPQLTLMSIESGFKYYSVQSLDFVNAKVRGAAHLLAHQLIHLDFLEKYYSVHFVFCNLVCLIRQRFDNDAFGFMVNPLRGEVLRLPPIQTLMRDWTGMGLDSTTNAYKILRVSGEFSNNCVVLVSHVLVLGTNEWRRIPSTPPFDGLDSFNNVCAFGDMHWLLMFYTRQGMEGATHILSFDFKKEDFFFTPNPPNYVLPTSLSTSELHLTNFRGSMVIVDATSSKSIMIWVMKDYHKKQWRLDYTIPIQKLKLGPMFRDILHKCCEWEHGILFMDKRATRTLLLDLRTPVVTKKLFNPKIQGQGYFDCRRIMSLNGSLLSLKSFANLDGDEEQPPIYGEWNEGEASGKNFFYLTM